MKLDLNLLKRLLVIDHPSKQEWPMLSAIINECYKIGNVEFEIDSFANIFVTKNTSNPDYYVGVIAHTDCVLQHNNKSINVKNGKIFGRNPVNEKQIGLGADDTVGVCIALQLLKAFPDLKVCFTTEEEIGFNGADTAAENINFFHDVSYLIQADRHGSSDLITFTNGIYSASEDWLQEVTPIMCKHGYKEEYGIGTDVGVISEKLELSGVNISCGYYSEHTDKEYIVISETQKCLDFMEDIIKNVPLDRQYEIKIDYKAYNRYFGSKSYEPNYKFDDTIDDGPDDEMHIPCDFCKDYDCMNCPHDGWWNESKW